MTGGRATARGTDQVARKRRQQQTEYNSAWLRSAGWGPTCGCRNAKRPYVAVFVVRPDAVKALENEGANGADWVTNLVEKLNKPLRRNPDHGLNDGRSRFLHRSCALCRRLFGPLGSTVSRMTGDRILTELSCSGRPSATFTKPRLFRLVRAKTIPR